MCTCVIGGRGVYPMLRSCEFVLFICLLEGFLFCFCERVLRDLGHLLVILQWRLRV